MIKKILLTTILFLLSFNITFAFDGLIATNSEVKAAEIEELDKREEERTKEIANLLGFVLPEYSDNPSYVITFTDPSIDKKGVEIELDNTNFKPISSPYTLPALSIGKHTVEFRFYDKDGNVQLLDYDLIIIPRPPIISSPVLEEDSVTFSGTALSNSEIIYRLSAGAYNQGGVVESDENGNWNLIVTPDAGLTDGIYTFSAYTRKYGYASNMGDAVTFGIGESNTNIETEEVKEIFFSFNSIKREEILDIFKNNKDLIFLGLGFFLIGILLSLILKSLFDGFRKEKKEKIAEEIISKQKKVGEESNKTLREMLGGQEEKPVKEASIINKDIFLKKYKNLDPDKESGKENNSKKIKKSIKISLTSKEG